MLSFFLSLAFLILEEEQYLNNNVAALVRVRNNIRRPDERIAIAMPPRIGTNTTSVQFTSGNH